MSDELDHKPWWAKEPMPLPDVTVEHNSPDICAVCHAPADKYYTVDRLQVKLCDKHKPVEPAKPKKRGPNPDQMEMF